MKAIVAIRAAVMLTSVAVFLGPTRADPDLWGHVRFGLDALQNRAIARHDSYSFTSDRPWINHEWLAELAMGISYQRLGSAGLVALKLLLIAASLLIVDRAIGRQGLRSPARELLLAAVILGAAGQMLAVRPQLFSVLAFSLLLALLVQARERFPGQLYLLPLLLVAWANLHGGWIVGLAVLGIWVACETWTRPAREIATLVLALAASAAATLVNPYGFDLWRFLWTTVGLERTDVIEWSPILSQNAGLIAVWCGIAGLAAMAVGRGWRTLAPAHIAIVLALAYGSFRVSRLLAFFALAVGVLLAPAFRDLVRISRRRSHIEVAQPSSLQGMVALAVLAVPIGAAAVVAAPRWGCIAIDASRWPVPDPSAARFIRAHHLTGRAVTPFDWGEYALWHFAPSVAISMDGRRETVYSDRFRREHAQIFSNPVDAPQIVERLEADYVWLPRRAATRGALEQAGWRAIFASESSALLTRRQAASARIKPWRGDLGARRCFPGP